MLSDRGAFSASTRFWASDPISTPEPVPSLVIRLVAALLVACDAALVDDVELETDPDVSATLLSFFLRNHGRLTMLLIGDRLVTNFL